MRYHFSLSTCKLIFLFSLFCFASRAQIESPYKPYGSQEAIDLLNAPIGSNLLRSNIVFKTSFYVICNGGWGLSFCAGGWVRNERFQGSTNLSLSFVCGRKNLGNKENVANQGNNNTYQFNLNFSPMLTVKLANSNTNWFHEEINPMYFGQLSGVYNSFQSAFTLGSNFIAYPKGSYNNITSPRNRSQQLVFFQIKAGGTPASSGKQSYFNSAFINVYEDYLFDAIQPFADLRDRFYTGGGNLQIRSFNNVMFKYYTETYTGNSYVDKQDYPDLVLPGKERWTVKKKTKSHPERFAYQDAGQLGLNKSRNLVCIEIQGIRFNNSIAPLLTNIEFIWGKQGDMTNAWSQHIIHNLVPVQKNKTVFDPGKTEKLHHFDFRNCSKKMLLGIHVESFVK